MHSRQDFATRDRYRHVIEDVARGSSCGEMAVAREAIVLARAAAGQQGRHHRTAHVGYYLIGRGRLHLESMVGCRLSLKTRLKRASRPLRLRLYLGAILLLTLFTTACVLFPLDGFSAAEWRYWFFTIMVMIGASALSVALVNLAVTLFLPPRGLPRLDFSQGIPDVHRTMVVVPTLLGSRREVDSLIEALEIRYLGNRDPNLYFALLTDFPDASEQTLPEDAALLAYARSDRVT